MRVFVTGATGFIGKAVVAELIEAGHTVLGLTRSQQGAETLKSLGAEVHEGDLDDIQSLKKGAADSDGVIHCAFKHSLPAFDIPTFQKNCEIDRSAIQAIADVLEGSNKPLIVTSGTLMLPSGRLGTEDEKEINPQSPLAAARAPSEQLTLSLASKGIRTAVLRLAPVNHGDTDFKGFVIMMIAAAKKNAVSSYIGEGQNTWPTTHILDTARAYRLALEKAPAGSMLHAVGEEGVKLQEIAKAIGKKMGVPVRSQSMEEAREHFGWLSSVVGTDNLVSSKKTQELLGWKPEHVSLLADITDGHYCRD